ncbi:putative dihydroorotase [Rhypophila sp. PSN 637]
MALKDSYELPAAADMHVHLRNAPGPIAELVTPTIRKAGVDTVFVMPNLAPKPVVSVAEALEYKAQLQAIDPSVNYLMSLYLHSSITPDEIREAKKAGIAGVKAYPKGATTNSQWGVVSFDPFHEVLKTMEEEGIVLNLHGEVPSNASEGVTVMNAESKFLPVLKNLVDKYPRLKIVLEHCTTADAVETVRSFGENVVGTITAHHLSLLVDDWSANVNNYCKPSAKSPEDRKALLNAVIHSKGKFFLGTDSAPHDISAKKGKGNTAAGVFTQPYALGYVLTALEEAIVRGDIASASEVTDDSLAGFFSTYGRSFYNIPQATQKIRLTRDGQTVLDSLKGTGAEIVPFRAGEKTWGVEWL